MSEHSQDTPPPATRHWSGEPPARAFLTALLLAAIMFPYWWLAVEWAKRTLPDPSVSFTFSATTFLLLLILADSMFLIRYYQLIRKRELVQKTEELKKSEDALRMANRKLNLLSGITRHDIKNQLMALKTYILLSNDSCRNTEELAGFFSKSEIIAETIERQINFTKDYEDMGVNAPVWQYVNKLVQSATAELPMNNIQIVSEQPDLEVFADPLLVKVFYNLIDNALRYGGEKMTTIRLTHREDAAGCVLVIEDDGAGIRPEMKRVLFTKGAGTHTGLGLFLTREILGITGMTIEETGLPGQGARFEIHIPRGVYRYPQKK